MTTGWMVEGPKLPITRRAAASRDGRGLHGQDLGVDRGGVDLAVGDQPDGALVEAGLRDAAEEAGPRVDVD